LMQENSKKRLLKTENKSFFDLSIYEYIGCIGVLESDIKKLDLYKKQPKAPVVLGYGDIFVIF